MGQPLKLTKVDFLSGLHSDIQHLGISEYLNHDPRPTFIIDGLFEKFTSQVKIDLQFANDAFLDLHLLHREIIRALNSAGPHELDDETQAFLSWLEADAATPLRSQPKQARIFRNILWSLTVICDRWAVVSGAPLRNSGLKSVGPAEIRQNGTMQDTVQLYEDFPGSSASSSLTPNVEMNRKPQRRISQLGGVWPSSKLQDTVHLTFIRQFDWDSHPLGPIDKWSPQLRQAVELILSNPEPATIFWGPDLSMIYNEPYIAVAGNKHPALMGGSSRIHFAEVWEPYEQLFQQMKIDGKSFKQEHVQMFLHRREYIEEAFFNLTVLPLLGAGGSVEGFLQHVFEITRQVLSERRMHTLLRLGESTSSATSLHDLWRLMIDVLKDHGSDVHFSILYSLEQRRGSQVATQRYKFEGAAGFHHGTRDFTPSVDLEDGVKDKDRLGSAFYFAHQTGASVLLKLEDGTLSKVLRDKLGACGLAVPCREVVVCPLLSSVDDNTAAFLTIGISPARHYDDDYRLFVQLLVRQIETAIASVKLFEKEKARVKEQAAYESEQRFRRFAERAPVGIVIFGAEFTIKFCNAAWLKITGHARDNMAAMSWTEDVHPDCIDTTKEYWNKLVRLEGPQTFEVQYKKPWKPLQSGSDVMYLDRTHALASAYAEVSENGTLRGITACVIDVSHQKWAEWFQSQKLSEALEMKRQQENFMDITSHEMRNPLNAILHCASELIELLTEQSVKVLSIEERASIVNDCLDASRTIAYCGRHQKRIIDDVLTLSKLDSDLLRISPLETRPIEVVAEVLKVFDAELRASLIQTMTDLTPSYLELGIDTVLMDPHRVIQILINLVANAIKFTKTQSLRQLRIIISASFVEPANESSGVRYAPSGRHRKNPDPTAAAQWGTGESLFLHFSVQDTGPGMTQEEANMLFNRFVQGSPRTHAQYGGSGLGLFISRELAELHGGRVGISTQLGLGSTFDFYIKCRRAMQGVESSSVAKRRSETIERLAHRPSLGHVSPDAVPQTMKSAPSVLQVAPKRHALHVLIVEDNLVNQKILSKLMRKEGFDVSIANHGKEALETIKTSTWAAGNEESGTMLDIVLADIEMPVMDGKECVRRIRERQRQGTLQANIPVIAVTGNARSEQITDAKECGFDDVVSKPYRADDLIKRIYHFTKG